MRACRALRRSGLTVHDEDPRGFAVRCAQPGDDLGRIGVHAERRQVHDLAAHPHVASEHLQLASAVGQRSTARALRLVAHEHHGRLRFCQEAGEVVHHAATTGHAARGHDDLGFVGRSEALGSLAVVHLVDPSAEEGRWPIEQLRPDLRRSPLDRLPIDLQRGEGHRAVDVHRHVGQPALGSEASEVVQQHLRAVDGERGDDDGSAPIGRPHDRVVQDVERVGIVVQLVSVRALHHDPVGVTDRFRWEQQWVRRTSEVAAEGDDAAVQFDPRRRRPEDVTGAPQRRPHSGRDLSTLARGQLGQLGQGVRDVVRVVQRQSRMVARVAGTVGEPGLLLLEMGGVRQHDAGQPGRVGRRVDGSAEPVGVQLGEVPAVVEVGVGQHHGRQQRRVDRKRCPVLLAQVAHPLEQSAVDHDGRGAVLQPVLAPGHGARTTEEPDHRWVGPGHLSPPRSEWTIPASRMRWLLGRGESRTSRRGPTALPARAA